MIGNIKIDKNNVLMDIKKLQHTVDITGLALPQMLKLCDAFGLTALRLDDQLYTPMEFLELASDLE